MKSQTIIFLSANDVHQDILDDIAGSEMFSDNMFDSVKIYNRKVLLRAKDVNGTVIYRKQILFKKLQKKGVKLFGIIE